MSGKKPFWKRQHALPREDDDQKAQEVSNKDGGVLYLRVNSKTQRQETNYPDWQRYWEEVRIGKYGTDFKIQLDTREWRPFNLTERLAEYPPQKERNTDREFFVPSEEQQQLIDALGDATLRTRQKKLFCNAWQENQREENVTIKAANECQKTLRDVVAKDFAEYPDKVTMLFADINASMTEMSRLKVQAYKRGTPSSADYMDYEKAVTEKRWLWMFEAAEATHLMRGAEKDEVVLLERQQAEYSELRSFHQGHQDFTLWLRRFEDKIRDVEAVGYAITDLQKRVALVNTLNPDVFEDLRKTWNNLALRTHLPSDFSSLKDFVITTYSTIDQGVISRARRGEKTESSFPGIEKRSEAGGRACNICGASGSDYHSWRTCSHYNNRYTLEQNAEFFARKTKQAGSAPPDAADKTEKNNMCLQLDISQAHEAKRSLFENDPFTEGGCVTLAKEACLQAGVRKDEVDFVLDTGTETGASNQRGRQLLDDIRAEHAVLEGVGGHLVHVKEVGSNIFGKSRVVDNKTAYNLVSQAECGEKWQIINPSKDHVYLKGWEGGGLEHIRWDFYRNEEKYHDKLLHCTLPMHRFRAFISTFHAMSLYKPADSPTEEGLLPEDLEAIRYVEEAHLDLGHASAQAMIRTIEAEVENDVPYHKRLGISVEDVGLWVKYRGKWCTGCLLGKMTEHDRIASCKEENSLPGEDGACDLLFVEQARGGKRAIYSHTDIGSKCRFLVDMAGKTERDLQEAVSTVKGYHATYGHTLKTITFDRESAVVAIRSWLVDRLNVRVKLKAAHQKVGLAEVDIRLLKDGARATKAGVKAIFGYSPPAQWNLDLCHHVNSCQNALVRTGMSKPPAEVFTGRSLDRLRDLRGLQWGQPVLAKRPALSEASDLREKAEWAVPVRVYRDGSGVIKVYLVETKRFAHRLKIVHAKAPEAVLEALRSISPDAIIGFEDESDTPRSTVVDSMEFDHIQVTDDFDAVGAAEAGDTTSSTQEAIDDLYERLPEQPIAEPDAFEDRYIESEQFVTDQQENAELPATVDADEESEQLVGLTGRYPVRNRKQKRLADYVYVLQKAFAMTYEKALKVRPESATRALGVELDNISRKGVWHGVHERDLSSEEKELVIDMMKNFKTKFLPTGEFEKDKVRVLVRGDKQKEDMLGETYGPVCRVESIFLLSCIAVLNEYKVFKIDFVAAYLNTDMPTEVKHKWLKLDRSVSTLLCERDGDYWRQFLMADGRILVQMDKLLYGYKEAAHYWWEALHAMFLSGGFEQCGSDECGELGTRSYILPRS